MMQETDTSRNSDKCRITFIIGNGFDLNLGMKTSYADIYETYMNEPSKSDAIVAFKQELSNRHPYDKWADFEIGMAEYATSLQDEDTFIECVRDFKVHMVKHLDNEVATIAQKLFSPNYAPGLAWELERSLQHFHEGLVPNISKQLANLWHNKDKDFCFFTFNYTDTLSFVISAVEEYLRLQCGIKDVQFNPNILHIHGQLTRDVVLGVDNEAQLSALPYQLSVRGKRAFIKPYFNKQYDTQRIVQARNMINKSTIICIYGFSMGATDQMWVDLLAEWLRRDAHHHLICFEYDPNTYARCNFDELMDVEDLKRERLLKRLGFTSMDKIAVQVHVPIAKKIFEFDLTKGIKEIEEEVKARNKLL